MAKELKTKSYAFDCDYCVPLRDGLRNQLFIRLFPADKLRAITAFDDPAELEQLTFCDNPVPGFTRLASYRNEGERAFFVLEG